MDKRIRTVSYVGLSFQSTLFLLFLGLKLGNVIDWNWWLIFSPYWIPIAFFIGLIAIAIIIVVIGAAIKTVAGK